MLGRSALKAQCDRADPNYVLENVGWAFVAMAGGAFALLTTLLVDQAR